MKEFLRSIPTGFLLIFAMWNIFHPMVVEDWFDASPRHEEALKCVIDNETACSAVLAALAFVCSLINLSNDRMRQSRITAKRNRLDLSAVIAFLGACSIASMVASAVKDTSSTRDFNTSAENVPARIPADAGTFVNLPVCGPKTATGSSVMPLSPETASPSNSCLVSCAVSNGTDKTPFVEPPSGKRNAP